MLISSPETDFQLFRIFDTGISADPLDEIIHLIELVDHSTNAKLISSIHHDIKNIFKGNYPGFKENSNKYHNLRHTYAVALATIRLFHGLTLHGHTFSPATLLKGMLSAYFHDTGLLLRSFDTAENGAEYTRCHENRSIDMLANYLEFSHLDDHLWTDCSAIIRGTNIELDFQSLDFSAPEIKLIGQIVGTADILAQMADRYYLEQLPHLYQERRAGGVMEHLSAFELMRETESFFHDVIVRRLEIELGNRAPAMRAHFRQRWNIDRDLYREKIEANISYLLQVVNKCHQHPEDISKYLQRRPPEVE